MEHRRRVQSDAAVGDRTLGEHVERIAEQAGMGQHHAFGDACCASGVQDAGEVIPGAHCVRDRIGRIENALVGQHAGRRLAFVRVDHGAQRL